MSNLQNHSEYDMLTKASLLHNIVWMYADIEVYMEQKRMQGLEINKDFLKKANAKIKILQDTEFFIEKVWGLWEAQRTKNNYLGMENDLLKLKIKALEEEAKSTSNAFESIQTDNLKKLKT